MNLKTITNDWHDFVRLKKQIYLISNIDILNHSKYMYIKRLLIFLCG